jgi:hypothetical protein
MIAPEDRGVVIAVATQMWCARIAAFEARKVNGETKWGYSPDMEMCVGEAAALVKQVDIHIAPKDRKAAAEERRKNPRGAIVLEWSGGAPVK